MCGIYLFRKKVQNESVILFPLSVRTVGRYIKQQQCYRIIIIYFKIHVISEYIEDPPPPYQKAPSGKLGEKGNKQNLFYTEIEINLAL